MSSYIEFYIHDGDKPHYLCAYSRSSALYRAFVDYIHYGEYVVVTEDKLNEVTSSLNAAIEGYKNTIKQYQEMNQYIMQANNDLDEKVEAIAERYEYITECEQEINDARFAVNVCAFLSNIVEEAFYENRKHDYLWVGIDASWGDDNEN